MSEMKYGKGLGFVGYAEKLYQWSKEYPSVKGMEGHLRDGLLMFLWLLYLCVFDDYFISSKDKR